MAADLTRRAYAAAQEGGTREEIARAVCHELAEWLDEESVLYSAKLTSSRRGIRAPSAGARAHMDVIDQLADHLGRVGDERRPA